MSQYVQQLWEDRIVEYPNRYKDQNGNILTLTEFPGNVAKEGTLVEAVKMNNIENGIANLYNAFKIAKTTKVKITSTYKTGSINYPAGMNKNNCLILNFKINIYDKDDNLVKSFSRWALSGSYENEIRYTDNGIFFSIFLDNSDNGQIEDVDITNYYIEIVFLFMNKDLDFSSITEENDFVTDITFNDNSLVISFLNKEKKYIDFSDFINDNADSYDKRITDNSNRINRIEGDLFDSGTASGKSINLKDSTLAEFQEVGIEGVIKQETTKGYQLLNLPNGTENGITYSVDDDGYLNFSGTCTSDRITLVLDEIPLNGTYTFTTKTISGSSGNCALKDNTSSHQTIFIIDYGNQTLTNLDVTANRLVIYLKNGTTYNTKLKLMLVSGNEEKDIEKYTGGEPSPSPDYPQEIEVIEDDFDLISCDKNLYYGSNDNYSFTSIPASWYFIDGQKGASGLNFGSKTLFKARVKEGEVYTFKALVEGDGITSMSLVYDDETTIKKGSSIWEQHTFTASKDGFVILRLYVLANNSVTISNVQLEQGTVATDYEPYRETRTTITLPEGEFAGKIDENTRDKFRLAFNEADGNYHLYLDKMLGKVVLDGSETYVYEAPKNRFRYHNTKISNKKTRQEIKSNYFCFSNEDKSGMAFSFERKIYLYNYACETVDEFKNWLSTHNTEVYCLLETPYTLDLGVVDMPLSYYPVTNVYTTCDLQPTIEVQYYRDFKGTVKQLHDEVTTLEKTSVKNTDYATITKAGLLRPNYTYCTNTDMDGYLIFGIRSLDAYKTLNDNAAISKGTLEQVLKPIRDKLEELSSSITSEESEVVE